jgi:hypothetical protein
MKACTTKLMTVAVAALLLRGDLIYSHPNINERERRQQRRIFDGVQDGELTRKEVKKLEREQAKIHYKEAKAKADGDFTAKERARIQKKQNHASRHIYREKHDHQARNRW